ncbi:DUF2171 domain-containing protein [Sphingomonas sp. SUN019]|uniref:DUF2171 domain-containing protein n=1 Tax=Sphingomonas sp. SUN019 TaxID=2937788 RepID=UPI002164E9BE|nr:DUF2171 domain-containing protein [Sphingomonas sp. SUN019]UVO50385.1 DUF2171 domain-containing protein [Sphingomonas sp. SUN019]
MGYERYPRGNNPQGDRYDRDDYGRDDRGARYDREYRDQGRAPYGQREYGNAGYAQRDRFGQRGRDDYRTAYGQHRDRGEQDRFAYGQERGRDYGRQPQGYDYDERGFFARAGDEVRSWFGDDEAERRREADLRYDDRGYDARSGADRDSDYHGWRRGQIAALDRDYDEYRRENRSKFENEFATWRTTRQGQRDQLGKVEEHMDVVGSDGSHVGTVDKVRGDRILLTKSDADAGGRHHSIPCGWIAAVDAKVTLAKTADEAKKHWKDEERKQALFGDRDDGAADRGDAQGRMLNRSFSGTY